jgi:dienelactone hydrolase
MRIVKKVAIGLVATVVVCLVASLGVKGCCDARYYHGYNPDAPLNAVIRGTEDRLDVAIYGTEDRTDYRRVDLTFEGVPGQPVPTLLTLPIDGDGPFPCIVFLHGIGQKKDFLDDIAAPFVKAGFAMVSSDQYTRGERKLDEAGPLTGMLRLRRRAALNVLETRRLVDYLETRPDIAADRIYLVGASFGAITGSTAAAFEKRFKAAVLVYGGGDLRALMSSDGARAELGDWTNLVARAGAFALAPADPLRHVDEIAPRPVLFQNGDHDSLIPSATAQALFDVAEEPKEMIWYDSDHVGLDEQQTWEVLNEALAWLERQDSGL